MAPSLKGQRKKKSSAMAENESENSPEPGPAEGAAGGSPGAEGQPSAPEKVEQAESPAAKPEVPSEAQAAEESGDEQVPASAKEEEQSFLVNLYKFMKERDTPIERVPHLGFKQINLFKIYKVVEKLGAYELVTGRRLWKNVYDMLGGSPGSTSAATCTRRHYERLVLPYVRHLKGEDDKPLPPVKPRKPYKVSKEPKGDQAGGSGERKRAKKERSREQGLPEKTRADPSVTPKPANGEEQDLPQDHVEGGLPLTSSREPPESQAREGCHGACGAHGCSETYKQLFSGFYFKGNHGIMSPLAKKKLLAQVSKDESFYSHGKHLGHCLEHKEGRVRESPGSDVETQPQAPSAGQHPQERRTPGLEVAGCRGPPGAPQATKANGGTQKVLPSLRDGPADSRGPGGHPPTGPLIFRGYFHTSGGSAVHPQSGLPLRGPLEYYPGFKDFPESSSAYPPPGKDVLLGSLSQKRQDAPEDQPEDLRQKSRRPLPCWGGDGPQAAAFQLSSPGEKRGPSPFAHAKPSWAPTAAPLVRGGPQALKNGAAPLAPGQAAGAAQKKRPLEEDHFPPPRKLKAVAPFAKEAEPGSPLEPGPSPGGQVGLAKPKAAVPGSSYPVAPMPQVQDAYKGTMLRLPVSSAGPAEHLKGRSPPLIPPLCISPLVLPAFPTPLLTASIQPSDLCQPLGTSLAPYPAAYDSALRHRLYRFSTWHSQPAYASTHVPAFHRNTKL
ncbi:AT-rich interactive domain-containing protein 5A isoform X2 [Varanus komodoensis]|nr:AT-rich interactive domain-containing protein 5A isoform X2 [Varanus komodoensis]